MKLLKQPSEFELCYHVEDNLLNNSKKMQQRIDGKRTAQWKFLLSSEHC